MCEIFRMILNAIYYHRPIFPYISIVVTIVYTGQKQVIMTSRDLAGSFPSLPTKVWDTL